MPFFFLGILALAWMTVLLPAALRARQNGPMSSAQRFRRGMDLIAPSTPAGAGRWVMVPKAAGYRTGRSARQRRLERRRRTLTGLLWCTTIVLPAGLITGGVMRTVGYVASVALVSYVALLIGIKRREQEARLKVHSIEDRRRPDVAFHEPVRAAGGSR